MPSGATHQAQRPVLQEFLVSPGADVVFSHGDVLLVLGPEECLHQLNEG